MLRASDSCLCRYAYIPTMRMRKKWYTMINHPKANQLQGATSPNSQYPFVPHQDECEELSCIVAARRAPSAHNAQPWRLYPQADGSYKLCYAYADKLLADPDDRDALLSIGAFYETLAIAANLEGKQATFEPSVVQHPGERLELGNVRLFPLSEESATDPLAPFVAQRQTNRHPYQRRPLTKALENELLQLGCTLLQPRDIAPLVSKASVMAWQDRRFVTDLKQWTRFQGNPVDGMTCECLHLSWIDRQALRFALWRGRLAAPLARIYAQRDVYLTRHSAAITVLTVENRDPLTLFDCGRRLLRAWVTINAAGFSYHPISIVIDQPTVIELAEKGLVENPVAIFRVGYTADPAPWSNRRTSSC
jgi:hypothetical protein